MTTRLINKLKTLYLRSVGVSLDCVLQLRALTNAAASGPSEAEGEQWCWSLSQAAPFIFYVIYINIIIYLPLYKYLYSGMLVNCQALVSVIWVLMKSVWSEQTWPGMYLEAYCGGCVVGNSQISLEESSS